MRTNAHYTNEELIKLGESSSDPLTVELARRLNAITEYACEFSKDLENKRDAFHEFITSSSHTS